jgi:CheY-like chemotaxis protein
MAGGDARWFGFRNQRRARQHELPERPASVPHTPAHSARRILVVDDNVDAAASLALLLRLHRHEVFVAHDGLHAVEEAAAHLPDAVVMDIGMPGLNGYEAAQRIRRLPGMEEVRIIALTGLGNEEDRKRSEAAGFNAHLVKPADNAKLLALLQNRQGSKAQEHAPTDGQANTAAKPV